MPLLVHARDEAIGASAADRWEREADSPPLSLLFPVPFLSLLTHAVVMALYRSWPAVSQIWAFIRLPSASIVLVANCGARGVWAERETERE
jgi:hypothetical protein